MFQLSGIYNLLHFTSQISKKVPNHYSEHYPPKEKNAQESVLAPIFGDLSRSKKKLSEIKTPLVIHSRKDIIQNQNVILCKNEN